MAVHITQKEDGSFWEVLYQGGTIVWTRMADEAAKFQPADGSPSPAPRPSRGPGSLPLQALVAVAEVGATLWQTWEIRQHRQFVEAAHEQAQRIEWVTGMMGRWASIHRSGERFDLRSSDFLVREVNNLLEVLGSSKKVSLPQELLYDLDLIRDTFRSIRLLFAEQFIALLDNPEIPIERLVKEAFPGRYLDVNFIKELLEEPAVESFAKAKVKSDSSFEKDLSEAIKSAEYFEARLFPQDKLQLGGKAEVESGEAAAPAQLMKKITERLSGSLLRPRGDESKNEIGDRAFDFPELILLSAEFRRVRALNDAWLAVSLIASATLNEPISVIVSEYGMAVEPGMATDLRFSSSEPVEQRTEKRELQFRNAAETDDHL